MCKLFWILQETVWWKRPTNPVQRHLGKVAAGITLLVRHLTSSSSDFRKPVRNQPVCPLQSMCVSISGALTQHILEQRPSWSPNPAIRTGFNSSLHCQHSTEPRRPQDLDEQSRATRLGTAEYVRKGSEGAPEVQASPWKLSKPG